VGIGDTTSTRSPRNDGAEPASDAGMSVLKEREAMAEARLTRFARSVDETP
jgi:hypothetical protein